MIRTLYWLLRRDIAEKNHDMCRFSIDDYTSLKTPLILKMLDLELLDIRCKMGLSNTEIKSRILIQEKGLPINIGEPLLAYRIQGDDGKRSPMVLWRFTV